MCFCRLFSSWWPLASHRHCNISCFFNLGGAQIKKHIVEKESDSSKAETRTEELYRHRIDRPSQGHVVSNEHVSSKGMCKK